MASYCTSILQLNIPKFSLLLGRAISLYMSCIEVTYSLSGVVQELALWFDNEELKNEWVLLCLLQMRRCWQTLFASCLPWLPLSYLLATYIHEITHCCSSVLTLISSMLGCNILYKTGDSNWLYGAGSSMPCHDLSMLFVHRGPSLILLKKSRRRNVRLAWNEHEELSGNIEGARVQWELPWFHCNYLTLIQSFQCRVCLIFSWDFIFIRQSWKDSRPSNKAVECTGLLTFKKKLLKGIHHGITHHWNTMVVNFFPWGLKQQCLPTLPASYIFQSITSISQGAGCKRLILSSPLNEWMTTPSMIGAPILIHWFSTLEAAWSCANRWNFKFWHQSE